MLSQLFNRRSLLGTCLFLILSGEITVWQQNGLFTPFGFITLFFLYFTFFHLVESFIVSYKAGLYQVILFSLALFGILAFGFFHMEIADFVRQPSLDLITFLMRLQPAVFPVMAIYLLNQIYPRNEEKVLSFKFSLALFLIYALIMTPTNYYGIYQVIQTLQIAPVASIVWILVALFGLKFAFKPAENRALDNKFLKPLSLLFLVISLIPIVYAYIILIIFMPLSMTISLINKKLRQGKI